MILKLYFGYNNIKCITYAEKLTASIIDHAETMKLKKEPIDAKDPLRGSSL